MFPAAQKCVSLDDGSVVLFMGLGVSLHNDAVSVGLVQVRTLLHSVLTQNPVEHVTQYSKSVIAGCGESAMHRFLGRRCAFSAISTGHAVLVNVWVGKIKSDHRKTRKRGLFAVEEE